MCRLPNDKAVEVLTTLKRHDSMKKKKKGFWGRTPGKVLGGKFGGENPVLIAKGGAKPKNGGGETLKLSSSWHQTLLRRDGPHLKTGPEKENPPPRFETFTGG